MKFADLQRGHLGEKPLTTKHTANRCAHISSLQYTKQYPIISLFRWADHVLRTIGARRHVLLEALCVVGHVCGNHG